MSQEVSQFILTTMSPGVNLNLLNTMSDLIFETMNYEVFNICIIIKFFMEYFFMYFSFICN